MQGTTSDEAINGSSVDTVSSDQFDVQLRPKILYTVCCCAGGAQVHRISILRATGAFVLLVTADHCPTFQCCFTSVHLAAPSEMPAGQSSLCPCKGDDYCTLIVCGLLGKYEAALKALSSAVAKWHATPGQGQDSVFSTCHLAAEGDLTFWLPTVLAHDMFGMRVGITAVGQAASQARVQACIQSVPVIITAVHFQRKLVSIPSFGRHAKGHAATDLVSCAGSCWHQQRSVLLLSMLL